MHEDTKIALDPDGVPLAPPHPAIGRAKPEYSTIAIVAFSPLGIIGVLVVVRRLLSCDC